MVYGTRHAPSLYSATEIPNTYLQKKKQKEAENAEGQAAGSKRKKVTAAQLRVQKGKLPLL
jgi:hypothetical protein